MRIGSFISDFYLIYIIILFRPFKGVYRLLPVCFLFRDRYHYLVFSDSDVCAIKSRFLLCELREFFEMG